MAWTTPRTWVAGEFVTDTLMNTHVRDNFLAAFPNGTAPLSWTPGLGGTTSASGQAYSLQEGLYVRAGDEIRFTGRLTVSTLGTITGSVVLTGLPVSAPSGNQLGPVSFGTWGNMGANFVSLFGYADPGTSRIQVKGMKAAGVTAGGLVQTDLTNTSTFGFGGSYFV